MRAFTKVVKKTAVAAAFMSLVPIGGVGFDVVGIGAAYADTVSSVVVQGNQRVEAETVRSYVTIRPGRAFSARDIDDSLKALYATGLFSDVQIQSRGGALVVVVAESPLVNRVSFEGNKRLTDEQLGTIVEIKPRSFMSRSKVQSDTQRLLEAYRRNGRFRAVIEPKIIEQPGNRVDLVFEIDEGDKTAVSRISFVGNNAFSDGRLRDIVKTRETGLLGFIRSTDTYDPDRLNQDQELLRKYYLRNGYADFRIVSATADLDRERNIFFVNFTVEEGDLYRFGDIDVQSTLPGLDPAVLRRVVETAPGAVYNAGNIESSMEAIVAEASGLGFSFAQVRPRAVRDYQNKTISIIYYVDEGPRVYVERINVRGNNRTRDYVIRREFDIAEGDAYNRAYVTKAERRLNRLGFFKNVRVTTEQGSSADRVVMNVDVEEQSTGELGFGAGYSTAEGIIGDVSLAERNFLGRGQLVKASVKLGESQRGWSLGVTEPYFLGRRITAGFDVYSNKYEDTFFRSYSEETQGGAVRFGLPITENLTIGASYSLFSQNIMLTSRQTDGDYTNGEASFAYKQYINPSNPLVPCGVGLNCSRETVTSMPGFNIVYNSVDNFQFPRDGIFAKLNVDVAGLGGDVNFVRTTGEARYYKELNADWGVVGMLKVKGGHIAGFGGKDPGVINNFFLGGETIRGFASSGIGVRDISTVSGFRANESLGGTTYVAVTAEAMFPFPFTPDEFGLYGAVFADAGTLFGTQDAVKREVGTCLTTAPCGTDTFRISDDSAIRSSVGAGIVWRSPFGPLRADFGFALTKGSYDKTQVFRFSGGTQF